MSDITGLGLGQVHTTSVKKISTSQKELLATYDTTPVSWVGSYIPPFFEAEYGHNFPFFRRSLVPTIQRDPRVRFGLNIIKGPIQAYTVFLPEEDAEDPMVQQALLEQGLEFAYGVKCKDKKVQELIISTLNRFWQCGLQESLLAIDWGYSVCQIMYQKGKEGERIRYQGLKHIHPFNCEAILSPDKRLVGVKVRGSTGFVGGKDIKIDKIIWHVHGKEFNPLFGQSRLEWCFVPWHETWVQYGARDIRRTWFHRNSYDGGSMRYPIGRTKLDSGNVVENRDLAIEMMTQQRTGGVRVMPNELLGDQRTPAWEYEAPSANATPQGLMEYPEILRAEILESLGIPPEVIEGGGGGLGAATGRMIPLRVYYSSLTPLVNNMINDVKRFIIDTLIKVNYQKEVDYDIYKVIPLKSAQAMLQPPGGPENPTKGTKGPESPGPVSKPKPKAPQPKASGKEE